MQGKIADSSPVSMEVSFDPGVSGRLFKVAGGLALSGNRSVPYLLLNATLLKGGRPLCSTKYLMIEVGSGRDCSFEISKNLRIRPGDYSCILEVLGPEGQMASEVRECRIIEPFLVETAPTPKPLPAREEPFLAEEQPQASADPTRQKGDADANDEKAESPDERDALSSRAGPSEEEVSGQGVSGIKASPGKPREHEETDEPEDRAVEASKSKSKALHEGEFVGSITSNKYHRQNCRYAAKISPENRVYFESEEEAEKQGYSPCKTCSP